MLFRSIIKLFENGNVSIDGLRGRGKDMLMANVVARRKLPYVSPTDYGGQWIPFDPKEFQVSGNTYLNFLSGKVKHYVYPYPDKTDLYLPDAGVYFPAQYCDKINRDFGGFATFAALSRHLGECNVHTNCQTLKRVWDKFREQSDTYIKCLKCKVTKHGWVCMWIRIYDQYQACVDNVPLFPLRKPFFNFNRRLQWELSHANYVIAHGQISERFLLFRNKSNYDTRFFREMLANGITDEKEG